MRDYLVYVRGEARRLFDAGVPVVEAAKRIDLGPYAGWTEPERIVFQVERAYRELRGEPYDTPLDVNVLFAGMHAVREAQRARAAQ
jgi:cyclase